MKKKDYIIYIIIFAVFILSLFYYLVPSQNGDMLTVFVNKDLYAQYPLYEDAEFEIAGENNIILTLAINEGKAKVIDSMCPDKLCEYVGEISETNESIICLPAKIVISIDSDKDTEFDAVSR